MKTVTIEMRKNGIEIKGLEEIKSREECLWLILAARMLEERGLEKGYLPELSKVLGEINEI